MARSARLYPKIQIAARQGYSEAVERLLEDGHADIAMFPMYGRFGPRGRKIIVKALLIEREYLICPANGQPHLRRGSPSQNSAFPRCALIAPADRIRDARVARRYERSERGAYTIEGLGSTTAVAAIPLRETVSSASPEARLIGAEASSVTAGPRGLARSCPARRGPDRLARWRRFHQVSSSAPRRPPVPEILATP